MEVVLSPQSDQSGERLRAKEALSSGPGLLTWVVPSPVVSHTGEPLDSYEALKSMRLAVLGSTNGSRRHARKYILFDVEPGHGETKNPAEMAQKRLEVLGGRCGTPLRCRGMEVSVDPDSPTTRSQRQLRGEASAEAPATSSTTIHCQPRHGRRESCPGNTFSRDKLHSCSPRQVVNPSGRVYPKAQSCDSRVSPSDEEHLSMRTPLAGPQAWAKSSKLCDRVPPTTTSSSQTETVLGCSTEESEPASHGSYSPLQKTEFISHQRNLSASQTSTSQGRPPGFLPLGGRRSMRGGMLISPVAQSDPVLLATSTAEDEGWCKEFVISPLLEMEAMTADARPLNSLHGAGMREGAGVRVGRIAGEGSLAKKSASKAEKHEKSMVWGRLFRHVSMDASALGNVIRGKAYGSSQPRKGPRRNGVQGLGARMVPDEKTQEYYAKDP